MGLCAFLIPPVLLRLEAGPQLPPHVHLLYVDPDGVVDYMVHDRVGVDAAAEPGMPVLLPGLRAEHGRRGAVVCLHELEQEGSIRFVGPVERPFVQHEDLEGGVLAHEPRLAVGLLPRRAPQPLQVGAPHVVHAGVSGMRPSR